MAGKKITELASYTAFAAGDLIEFVDVDDYSMGPGGTNKKVTLEALVGRTLFATPGSITPGRALVADTAGRIEGVSAGQLQRLNVAAGAWGSNKALTTDGAGRLHNVTAEQFATLGVTAGQWAHNKALVVDANGRVAGVSSGQFSTLNVAAGSFTADKVVVVGSNGVVSNANVSLNTTSTPSFTLTATPNSMAITPTTITATATGGTGSFAFNAITFAGAGYTTTYGKLLAKLDGVHGDIELDASGNPAFLRISLSGGICYLTGNSLRFENVPGGTLDIRLEGLPTSLPTTPYRLWVDTNAGNVLKIRLP